MKKVLVNLFAAVLSVAPLFAAGSRNTTNLTFSVTPIDKDETDDVEFGGAYLL